MDESFDFLNAVYEWDYEKEQLNFKKHGIHFKTAAKVFLDPYKLIREDEEHSQEERYNVLGRVGRILFVVYTLRYGNTVRLISARAATSSEKRRYEYGDDFDEYE
ncbi:MAG: BrnT family toxin [Oscillospiraceae bacterium]|nr:BrnT family toxin [Oscillospiraceae bacterium]